MKLEAKQVRIEDMKLEAMQLMAEKARMVAGLESEGASLAECNRLFSETVDIDSLVEFIEGKPLGAVPKRKCEEKSNVTTENILIPQKSEHILTHKTVSVESDGIKIDKSAPMRCVKSSNKSSLEILCLEVNQEVLQTSKTLNTPKGENNQSNIANETKNSWKASNSKSPDNATYKIQARKMDLQQKLQQMEGEKTNINQREDDLVVKHSKEMAKVLNFKTEIENDIQAKCKMLNVINSEMCSTETKLNDLKKTNINT